MLMLRLYGTGFSGSRFDGPSEQVLTTGAAAAATAAAPQVFAQAPQTSVPQGAPAGAKIGYYEKGNT